VQEKLVQNLIK